jgi:hypothetical protein
MNTLTREDLKKRYGLTVGRLKQFLNEHPELSDDAPVLVERVEDFYFEKNGWSVYLKEGEHYHYAEKTNQNMLDEIARRERGEKPEYGMENPADYIHELSDEDKNKYIPTWCCVKYPDEDILFIDLHY